MEKTHFPVWTRMLPREAAQQSWEEQSALAVSPKTQSKLHWRDLQFPGTAGGHHCIHCQPIPFTPDVFWQHCAICEPSHLSQLHPCCCSCLPLQQNPGATGVPMGGQGPVLLPQHSGWDSHSAICISEKQLGCILKTQGWNFLLAVACWQVLLCWITTFPIFLSWLIIPCV